MEPIFKPVTFNKGGSGTSTGRTILPKEFLDLMEVTKEEPNIKMTYENGKIIIEKAEIQPQFNKEILLNIEDLINSQDRKSIIKRLIEIEKYREFLRQETMSKKEYDYREQCFIDLGIASEKMKQLGNLLDDFESIKKKYGIHGVF